MPTRRGEKKIGMRVGDDKWSNIYLKYNKNIVLKIRMRILVQINC